MVMRVSNSFKDHELLGDDELSEGYDSDEYFVDFEECKRQIGGKIEKMEEEEEVKEEVPEG